MVCTTYCFSSKHTTEWERSLLRIKTVGGLGQEAGAWGSAGGSLVHSTNTLTVFNKGKKCSSHLARGWACCTLSNPILLQEGDTVVLVAAMAAPGANAVSVHCPGLVPGPPSTHLPPGRPQPARPLPRGGF